MSESQHLAAFRLGDVRGVYPSDIDEDFAYAFAHAFVRQFNIKNCVAIGRDMRPSSLALHDGLATGLIKSGINVVDLGLCATELGYYASSKPEIEAVIIITASHNPAAYNGFKCVLHGGVGVHFENGLKQVMALMCEGHRNSRGTTGQISAGEYQASYINYLEKRFDIDPQVVGKLALNGLNGTASTLAADIAETFALPNEWFRKEPGPIPKSGADPVNPTLLRQMHDYMQSDDFGLGVAWDGDCDRCVFFDGLGQHISSYYMVGFLADHILSQLDGGAIVYDTKVYWNLLEVINRHGATGIPSKTGHSFMKENMKQHRAVYGGELSSHHYFGDFFYCDSGMYAWLKVMEMLSLVRRPLEDLVSERRELFLCTKELSLSFERPADALKALHAEFGQHAKAIDAQDGVAFDMGDWRFSIRDSKTEPCVRVNIESTQSASELLSCAEALLSILEPYRAEDINWFDSLKVE